MNDYDLHTVSDSITAAKQDGLENIICQKYQHNTNRTN
uniref:Uncharacterized protein n=1 Tax=Anguilla anguilla TaxID=7936 RepID=A0A0E9QNC9_ANGAN